MKRLPLTLAMIAAGLLMGALLAPALAPLIGKDEAADAASIAAKLFMALTFVWFARRFGLSWGAIVVAPPNGRLRAVGQGLLIGWLIMVPVATMLVALDIRVLNASDVFSFTNVAASLASALVAGLLVGLIEEIFFRGLIFGGLARHGHWLTAAVVSSVIYALLHFVEFDAPNQPEGYLATSVALLLSLPAGFAALPWDSLFSLFLAGLLLAMVRQRDGHLYTAIGLHAGWVVVIKLMKDLTDTPYGSPFSTWVGEYDRVTGELASVVLAISIACYLYYWRRQAPAQ